MEFKLYKFSNNSLKIRNLVVSLRLYSTNLSKPHTKQSNELQINGNLYQQDNYTNVTPKVLSYLDRKLHLQPQHPINLVKQRIINYFYSSFKNTRGNPIFSVNDTLSPIVDIDQNFNSLLIPKDHPTRAKTDCYYINSNYLLRAHCTCHQMELIKSGLNSFLIVGDVYRRDEIDSTHYPVFHQLDAVHLMTRDQLFPNDDKLQLFEIGNNTNKNKQDCHTLEAVKLVEHSLKSTLLGLVRCIFGPKVECRFVDSQFPFTHPSFELEIKYKDTWLELLGCGIMKQHILSEAGATDRVGWAFGIGLERIAMKLYQIPDIRLFWSLDSGFLNQFKDAKAETPIIYRPISQYPQCANDISFWLPKGESYSSNDFYDLVRTIGGDIIEQVALIDDFTHPKTRAQSHCYRVVYRHMERTLTQAEVNEMHKSIEEAAVAKLNVVIR